MNAKQLFVLVNQDSASVKTFTEDRAARVKALVEMGAEVVLALRKQVKFSKKDRKKGMAWSQSFLALGKLAFGSAFSVRKSGKRGGGDADAKSTAKQRGDTLASLFLTLSRLAKLGGTKAMVLKTVNKVKWSKIKKATKAKKSTKKS